MRRSRKSGFTLKHPDRRNQVRHTGGTFTMKIYVEKTEAGYRPKVVTLIPKPFTIELKFERG